MTTVIGKTFTNETIVIDDHNFINCTFTQCEIVYTGGDWAWKNSNFENCQISITGDAAKTVSFMHQFGMLQQKAVAPAPTKPIGFTPDDDNGKFH